MLDAPQPDPLPHYAASASWYSDALDSGIADCVWDRLVLDGALPPHTRLVVEVLSAETLLTAAHVADSLEWRLAATLDGEADGERVVVGEDTMLRAPPGRFLWLCLRMETNGTGTPSLARIAIDYPRISWRRYLPPIHE